VQLYVVISEGLDIGAYRAAARVTGFTGLPGLEHISFRICHRPQRNRLCHTGDRHQLCAL